MEVEPEVIATAVEVPPAVETALFEPLSPPFKQQEEQDVSQELLVDPWLIVRTDALCSTHLVEKHSPLFLLTSSKRLSLSLQAAVVDQPGEDLIPPGTETSTPVKGRVAPSCCSNSTTSTHHHHNHHHFPPTRGLHGQIRCASQVAVLEAHA